MKKIFTLIACLCMVITANADTLLFEDTPEQGKMIGWGTGFSKENATEADVFCYKITTTTKGNSWDVQFAYDSAQLPAVVFENGKTYKLMIKAKASAAYSLAAQLQKPDGYVGCGDFTNLNLTTEWQDLEATVTCSGDGATRLLFSCGDFVGNIFVAKVSVYEVTGGPTPTKETLLIEDTPEQGKLIGWGTGFSKDNATEADVFCYKITTTTAGNPWEVQFAYDFTTTAPTITFENGKTYKIKVKAKASAAYALAAQLQNPEGYTNCGDFPKMNLTTEWQDFEATVTCNGDGANRLIFNCGDFVGNIFVAKVGVYELSASTDDETNPETNLIKDADSYNFNNLDYSFNAGSIHWYGWGSGTKEVVAPGYGGSAGCLHLVSPSAGNHYDSQLAYDVAIENGQTYTIVFFAKALNAGGTIQLAYQNASDYSGGGYQDINLTTDWAQYTVNWNAVELSKAMDRITINYGKVANEYFIDRFLITKDSTTGVEDVKVVRPSATRVMYNLQGVRVGDDYKGVVLMDGKKFLKR